MKVRRKRKEGICDPGPDCSGCLSPGSGNGFARCRGLRLEQQVEQLEQRSERRVARAAASAVSSAQAKYAPHVTRTGGRQEGRNADRRSRTAMSTTSIPAPPTTRRRYIVHLAADSPLMGWPPNDTSAPVPLLAVGQPTLTNGGKTITFKIKPNIHYSPPTGRWHRLDQAGRLAGRQVRDRARADARRSERLSRRCISADLVGLRGGSGRGQEGRRRRRRTSAASRPRTPRRSSST